MRKKQVVSCLMAGALLFGTQQVWAATANYNDSSLTGGAEAWNSYVQGWNGLANDFTYVSLTPGAAATELNFAWYNEGTTGTPTVYFGTDSQNLTEYTGTSNTVEASLTQGRTVLL